MNQCFNFQLIWMYYVVYGIKMAMHMEIIHINNTSRSINIFSKHYFVFHFYKIVDEKI